MFFLYFSMQFGHVRQANEQLYPIDWMDFDLAYYAEQRENIPTRHVVNFRGRCIQI